MLSAPVAVAWFGHCPDALRLIATQAGQPERKLSPDLLADIIKQTSEPPQGRFTKIKNIIQDLHAHPAPSAWGAAVGQNLIEADARVLPPCARLLLEPPLRAVLHAAAPRRGHRGWRCGGDGCRRAAS